NGFGSDIRPSLGAGWCKAVCLFGFIFGLPFHSVALPLRQPLCFSLNQVGSVASILGLHKLVGQCNARNLKRSRVAIAAPILLCWCWCCPRVSSAQRCELRLYTITIDNLAHCLVGHCVNHHAQGRGRHRCPLGQISDRRRSSLERSGRFAALL